MYIHTRSGRGSGNSHVFVAAELRAEILDFRGFDSSGILIPRGGMLMFIGNFPGCFGSTNLSRDNSEGGMIPLKTLIELKFPNSSFPSLSSY